MKSKKICLSDLEKEQLIRDLISTFKDRDELHTAFKEKIKSILQYAFYEFIRDVATNQDKEITVETFIEEFVENNFKPE